MKVVFSVQAIRSLTEIGDYIAKDNPSRAKIFIRTLREKAAEIGHNPLAHRLVPAFEDHGIRRKPHGNYLIFYRVHDTTITIINILHAAREFEHLLFPGT